MKTRLAVALALGAALGVARAEAPGEDPNDLGALEALVRKVELEGKIDGKRLCEARSEETLGDPPAPVGLVFPAIAGTPAAEREFLAAYWEKYDECFGALAKKAREAALLKDPPKGEDPFAFAQAFLKKFPKPLAKAKDEKAAKTVKATNEVRFALARSLEGARLAHERRAKLKGPALEAEIAARTDRARAFLKKHDYGTAIAKTRLVGHMKLYFDLTKTAYDLVKKNMGILKASPVLGASGKPLTFREKPLEGGSKIGFPDLSSALEEFGDLEYVVLQYGQTTSTLESGIDDKSIIRITIARLLFGRITLLELPDRAILWVPEG